MLHNLRAEMARYVITGRDIARLLGIRPATVSANMTGKSDFTYYEALKIKEAFFPHLTMEYLFED